MIIDREVMMRRRYSYVEGFNEIPVVLILHRTKKYHLLFT